MGIELPVEPYLREVGFTGPMPDCRIASRFTVDFTSGFYFHREGPGLLFGMADRDQPAGLDAPTDPAWLEKVMEVAERRPPALLDMGIAGGWKGYYEVTPDHNALVGESPDVARFLYATGFSGHGFLQGAGRRRDRPRSLPPPRAVRRRRTARGRALRRRGSAPRAQRHLGRSRELFDALGGATLQHAVVEHHPEQRDSERVCRSDGDVAARHPARVRELGVRRTPAGLRSWSENVIFAGSRFDRRAIDLGEDCRLPRRGRSGADRETAACRAPTRVASVSAM